MLQKLNELVEIPIGFQRFIGHLTAGFGSLFLFFAAGILFNGRNRIWDFGFEEWIKATIAVSIPAVIGILLIIAGLKILHEGKISVPKNTE